MVRLILIFASILFITNCSTPDIKAVNRGAIKLLEESDLLMAEGKIAEAARLLYVIKELHPNDIEIQTRIDKLTEEQKIIIEERPYLGFNKSRRGIEDPEPGVLARILYYIPDRIIDLLDVVSFDINYGFQIGAGIWFTRAIQNVAYTGSSIGFGYYQKKQLGLKSEGSTEFVLFGVGISLVSGARVGTGGVDTSTSLLAFHTPSSALYQEYRDYWGIGAKAGVGLVGAEVEIHPLEIYDFLLGLFLFDPMNDDLATTRKLNYSDEQDLYLKSYLDQVSRLSSNEVEEYKKYHPTVKGGKLQSSSGDKN